jgi:flagellar hook-basal body complex protein FliE
MAVPFNAATAAYGNAAALVKGPGASNPLAGSKEEGPDFAQFLSQSLQSVVDSGNAADQKAMDFVNGRADVVDVVTAVSQTEIAIESMVAVRDRVISAYEEIMRMPI